jgi:hypothetical protein
MVVKPLCQMGAWQQSDCRLNIEPPYVGNPVAGDGEGAERGLGVGHGVHNLVMPVLCDADRGAFGEYGCLVNLVGSPVDLFGFEVYAVLLSDNAKYYTLYCT